MNGRAGRHARHVHTHRALQHRSLQGTARGREPASSGARSADRVASLSSVAARQCCHNGDAMRSATVIEVPAGSGADDKVMSLDRLSTPALVLERGTLDRNIERLTARLRRLGVTLRPHLKTAKSRDVGRRTVPPRLRADHRINAEGSRVLRGRRSAGHRLCGWASPAQDRARSCSARTGRGPGGSHRHADPGRGAGRLNPRVRPTIRRADRNRLRRPSGRPESRRSHDRSDRRGARGRRRRSARRAYACGRVLCLQDACGAREGRRGRAGGRRGCGGDASRGGDSSARWSASAPRQRRISLATLQA